MKIILWRFHEVDWVISNACCTNKRPSNGNFNETKRNHDKFKNYIWRISWVKIDHQHDQYSLSANYLQRVCTKKHVDIDRHVQNKSTHTHTHLSILSYSTLSYLSNLIYLIQSNPSMYIYMHIRGNYHGNYQRNFQTIQGRRPIL